MAASVFLRVAYLGVSIGLGSAKMDGVSAKNDVRALCQ